ncbi:hypothetical protein POJ06DRAFT_241310 [Lipomyces tetrasporus]|uniref:Protein kinase domain-containing protein n=1 Tax=Lipomyces tetrasporus TaxID=54092 RepID=A0AAD7QK21_9ASCO|nr:uncharacterized protein POJ06DRAFT_241310 [Lipomyces tetrasporus]KAJ8096658.1 hypothetical protein POJ06DRAFT_241310 [Lipomyces tetrasporus]
MQGVSECPPILNIDLPPPLRLAFINDIEGPQNTYGHIVIRIKKHIRVRKSRHSQIVLVEIERATGATCPVKQQVVAKFFDPLFVPVDELPDDDSPEELKQVVTNHYSAQEAAAYSSLSSIQGSVVPIFYGEFACHFADRPAESDRSVKVILIEYIDGWPLSWYSPGELTESQAHWIALQTEAIVHQIHSHRVVHGDLGLRNFLLTKQRRMVLVDFEESQVLNGKNEFSPESLKEDDFIVLGGELEYYRLRRDDDS